MSCITLQNLSTSSDDDCTPPLHFFSKECSFFRSLTSFLPKELIFFTNGVSIIRLLLTSLSSFKYILKSFNLTTLCEIDYSTKFLKILTFSTPSSISIQVIISNPKETFLLKKKITFPQGISIHNQDFALENLLYKRTV